MEKYIFDQCNGLWYELQGDYYIPAWCWMKRGHLLLVCGAESTSNT